MKHRILVVPALIGLFTFATASGYAETIRLTADVPFEFVLGDRAMPAGEYTLEKSDVMRGAWTISGPGDRAGSFIVAKPGDKNPGVPPRLVFHRYGERYLLSQIWTSADTRALELPLSRMERELARANSKRGITSVAMR